MFVSILKKMPVLLVPALILVATGLLIPRLTHLTPARQELLLLAPYLVAIVGMFLAVHFHRGRPFLVLLVLLLFYRAAGTLVAQPLEPGFDRLYQAIVLLVPANIALFAVMHERGLLSAAGRLRLGFLALQAVLVVWLFRYHFIDLLPYIAGTPLRLPLVDRLFVPQPAALAGALFFLLTAALALRRQAPVDSGMLGAMASFFIASNWLTNRDIHTAYCTAGALIVTQSLVRDSYNMAFRDDLTGIPSRRALNESLNGLGRRYAIAMLDVDHFKHFNDSYGHEVGDQVLKMVAARIRDVGGGGKAYRYGGEEFTVVFPGKRAEDVLSHLEELRAVIADYRLALRSSDRPDNQRQGKGLRGRGNAGNCASVTVSIGVAESGEMLATPHEVIKAADKALYKAKNRGRNQIAR